MAVAVADDRFVHPQPGTSGADHLVSGLVPLALLALAAWALPRSRAWIALAAGTFGLMVGAEAVYGSGPGGDDPTGFASMAAGLALLGAGIRELWRTRRREGRLVWRYPRRALMGLAGFMVALPVAAAYVYAHTAKPAIAGAGLSIPAEHVRFDSVDGVSLDGRWIPSRNGAAVVAYPGRRAQVEMLARAGYGVLLFTRRGEGRSDGDPQRWDLARDIRGAIEFAASRPGIDPRRVGGIGLSVGGESMLQAAAESKALRAIVSEGAGARTVKESVHFAGPGTWLGIAGDSLYTVASAVFSDQEPPVDLLDDVGRIGNRPVFLIHTSAKGIGGEELNPDYYAALTGPREIWDIPDASHTGGFAARPKEYERRVLGFFARALR